jgi:hypothetical protein
MSIKFSLRFQLDDVKRIAATYAYANDDEVIATGANARRRGFLSLDDLIQIGVWKSPRVRSYLRSNDGKVVQEVTRFALSARTEQPRIEALTILTGVGWPMASVVLHLCHQERYPILDFRAVWSVGLDETPAWNFVFWTEYTAYCRELASKTGVSMRTLDQALWQYSKDHQPSK